jgi:hypothetical protein
VEIHHIQATATKLIKADMRHHQKITFEVHNEGAIYSEVTNVFTTSNKLTTCFHENFPQKSLFSFKGLPDVFGEKKIVDLEFKIRETI